jgi:glucan biosynthesis protein C
VIETASPRPESSHRHHGPHAPRHDAAPIDARSRPRYHEFDALRATAVLLVVTVHAALAYTKFDFRRLLWGVRDPSAHLAFDVFCWWAMGVSVSLFFTISGFFASEIYDSRGPSEFLRGRFRRIVRPFLIAALTILPLCFFAWAAGWLITGRCDLREIRRMRFADPAIEPDLYGPAHLWFLEYLILMLAGFFAFRHLESRRDPAPKTLPGRWVFSRWAPIALALPTMLILLFGRYRFGIDATFDRHNSFIPDPIRLLHYGSFFAYGVAVHRARADLGLLAARSPWYLLALAPVFAGRAWLLRQDNLNSLAPSATLLLAALGGLFAWLTVFGVLGLYRRLFLRPSRIVRYLAERSYWIYLIHLPIVGFVQADLYRLRWPTFAKFATTWVVTFAVGLASYRVLVRKPTKTPAVRHRLDPASSISEPIVALREERAAIS